MSELRAAYLAVARAAHPIVVAGATDTQIAAADTRFERTARAWAVLSDTPSRRLYDAAGEPAVAAVASIVVAGATDAQIAAADNRFERAARAWAVLSDAPSRCLYDAAGELALAALAALARIDARAAALKARLPGLPADELDHLADTSALVGALLSPVVDRADAGGDGADGVDGRDDVCPRSVDEAVENIRNAHKYAAPTVYYTLWWVYRFRVREAAPHLTALLSGARGARAFALRRRMALALGVVADLAARGADGNYGHEWADALAALVDSLNADDYFL